uniref:Uncharacterized protein n=1 Tax=Oryza glumipatula TaxID=40148 RepID=A0A0E0AED7_9ORYZ
MVETNLPSSTVNGIHGDPSVRSEIDGQDRSLIRPADLMRGQCAVVDQIIAGEGPSSCQALKLSSYRIPSPASCHGSGMNPRFDVPSSLYWVEARSSCSYRSPSS